MNKTKILNFPIKSFLRQGEINFFEKALNHVDDEMLALLRLAEKMGVPIEDAKKVHVKNIKRNMEIYVQSFQRIRQDLISCYLIEN